jgi:hypothetical protein
MERSRITRPGVSGASEAQCELAERDPDSIMGCNVGGEFVLSAA